MIIGLHGKKGAGKDEGAKGLVEQGYERVAFADKLKEFVFNVNPWVHVVLDAEMARMLPWNYPRSGLFVPGISRWDGFMLYQDVVDYIGLDHAKNNIADVRRLLQRTGTEGGRETLYENVWVDAALDNTDADDIVVTDVRFPNELEAIHNRGGEVIKIVRPDTDDGDNHKSETALDDYDFKHQVVNDGSIESLRNKITETVKGL